MFQSLANRNWLVKRIKNGRKASVSRCGTRHFPYRKVAQRGDARCDAADAADVQFPYRIDEFRQMVVSAIDQPFLSLSFSLLFRIDLFRPESVMALFPIFTDQIQFIPILVIPEFIISVILSQNINRFILFRYCHQI